MKEQQWITDRLPTTTDSDQGFVMIPFRGSPVEWTSEHRDNIKLGEPWAPWPKMPPFEPQPEYWAKPSDIPAEARWFLDSDGDCDIIQTVRVWGFVLAQDITIKWGELSEWRWSDRPFDRFEDGKPCVKGGSDE